MFFMVLDMAPAWKVGTVHQGNKDVVSVGGTDAGHCGRYRNKGETGYPPTYDGLAEGPVPA